MKKYVSKLSENKIFFIFCACILAFFLVCTRLLIKTDDGHFLGITANEGFSVAEWLKYRYETISGRTTSEGLMMFFLQIPTVFWKFFAGFCCIFIVWFASKISDAFGTAENRENRFLLCCCMIFLVGIGALNSGALWFSGSFTYLIPCTFMLLTLAPAAFDILGSKYNPILTVAAFPAALVAVSQEQSAVCTCCFFAFLLLFSIITKKIKVASFLPLIPSIAGTYYLLSSPGAQSRNAMHTSGDFAAFSEFGIVEKLLCGLSNYFGYAFFTSVFVTLLFAGLLCLLFYQTSKNKKSAKAVSVTVFAVFIAVCAALNGIGFILNRTSFDKYFQKCFQSGEFSIQFYIVVICCAAACAAALYLIFRIALSDKLAGLTVGLLFCAAAGCGIMMGFSSSIYASGQRVFFFTDILMLIACVILFSRLKPSRLTRAALILCAAVSLGFFLFDIFTFSLMEIPVMG